MEMIKKIGFVFNRTQKIKIAFLLILITIGALTELVGVAAVIPFINIVMKPDEVYQNQYLYYFYQVFHFKDASHFLVGMAIALIVIYVMKNLYLIFVNYVQYRFIFNNQKKLSCRLLNCYARQDYTYFLDHNTADLIRNIGQDTENFFEATSEILKLIMEVSVCVLLALYLLITDVVITITLVLFLLIIGGGTLKVIKKQIHTLGNLKRVSYGGRNKWIMQTFGGIKEVKVSEQENFFLKQYEKQYDIYVKAQKKYRVLSYIPRPVMETLCVGGLLLMIAIKLMNGADPTYFVSTLSVFAIAAFRLLPSFNRMSENVSRIMFDKSSVEAIYHDLNHIKDIEKKTSVKKKEKDKIPFQNEITIDNISFHYPNVDSNVLENVKFTIRKNQSVAFIGASGAGKTTLADIILGILIPQEGTIKVDEVSIYDNMTGWHNILGYIPQTIFLMDDTIRNNIYFGLEEDEIDEERLQEVLVEAQLKDFVDSLEDGLDTVIGESGVRLSGGQRQRIGIARALYRNPEVLILDEATSALDTDTETAVMEAINSLAGKKTLIIIAHRLSTIENCDKVYEIKDKAAVLKR